MKTQKEIAQLANEEYKDNLHNPFFTAAPMGYIKGYTKCQEDQVNDFLSMIEEYKEKELPNCNVPYHYEAEIAAGLNGLINFIKNKQ
jgi:hypothetical protein